VFDLTDIRARSIARTYVGVVTYREMAECLGWPQKAIGYADIIALRNDPRGWARYSCAKAEWGKQPLVAFTDPSESDTGRAVLFALWGMGAHKAMEELTLDDLANPETLGYVRGFAGVVDHYMATTSIVNTKVYQGPRYGHFFIMPEDNVIQLYRGKAKAFVGGQEKTAPAITKQMVMIYPKEGSLLRDNCACRVQASWVTAEQAEAAELWVSFLRADEQQRSFLEAGFRPGTDMAVGAPFGADYGLDPREPAKVLYSERVDPAVGAAIDAAWPDVKKPGIVTFVADTSGSMLVNDKLKQEKDGLIRALDSMAQNNRVGLVAFDEAVHTRVPVAPLAENKFDLGNRIHAMKAGGETALYDAIKEAVEMTDAAEGPGDAIRAVVVLTDGKANRGVTHLDDVVTLMSTDELKVSFEGMDDSPPPRDVNGKTIDRKDVIGNAMALNTRHPVQVFFISIGSGADVEIGRMMAEATGAEFQASTDSGLAGVIETFAPYF
jgi:Ca-activated chloride channel family protein